MTQTSLLEWKPRPAPILPRDPHVRREDRARLTGQNAAILARLKVGPATVDELAAISRKYTSRTSDLRAMGYVIECRRVEGGNNVYTLVL